MNDRFQTRLITGGHKGAEAEFGKNAARWNIPETTLTYDGHKVAHSGELETLSEADLLEGDVSMEFVRARLGRHFSRGKGIRRVLQSMFHVVNRGDHLFAVGWIQPDESVKGGTGWGVELAKFFNRNVSVYDQKRKKWFIWQEGKWVEDEPTIPDSTFSATGTRGLNDSGKVAIEELFIRSFGPAGS